MNYYNINTQSVKNFSPLQREIYLKLLKNSNKTKKEKESLTRSTLVKYLNYASSSISDALQALRKLGFVFYCKATKTWQIIKSQCKSMDITDLHIKFKWDWPGFKPFKTFIQNITGVKNE